MYSFLDYIITHPDAIATFKASDVVLAGHNDALYFFESKSQGRDGCYFSCPTIWLIR